MTLPAAALRLRAAPVAVPCLGAVTVLAWFAIRTGGYPVSHWAPGALVVLALLGIALVVIPNEWDAVPRGTRWAVALLAAYTAWCLASLLWARDPGAAWEDVNRSILYLALFCLFGLWRQRAGVATGLLGIWTAVVAATGAVTVAHLARVADPRPLLADGRMLDPTGYANATAGLFLMAFFPALLLAAARTVPWALRALAGGAAVVCLDASLLGQSRGALFALPLTGLLLIVLLPGRVRTLATLVPIAAAGGAAAPSILHLSDVAGGYPPPSAATVADAADRVAAMTLGGAVAVIAVLGAVGLALARRPPGSDAEARAHRLGGLAFGGAAAVGAVAALIALGNPATRLDHAWHSFKGGYTEYSGSRLSSGLGSNRYDFYRVGLVVFGDHPIAGVGAGNFFEEYLREGRSPETPRYAHSIELRALAETGAIGALLLFGALAAALSTALPVARTRAGAGAGAGWTAVAAGGALTTFAYWLIHGSADWFYEYAGLGAAAFALLGLVCGMAPRRSDPARPELERLRTAPRRILVPALTAGAAAAIALTGLWTSDHEVTAAGAAYVDGRSDEAYGLLSRAGHLNPFSDQPASVAGGMAVRLGDLPRADREFARALERSPDDQYATLERGAISSALGRRAAALTFLQRAAQLAPRDRITREALAIVRSGGTLDVAALDQRIAQAAQQLGR